MSLDKARTLLDEQRWQEAYEVLVQANREASDTQLERAMIDLLLQAAAESGPPGGITPVQPVPVSESSSASTTPGEIPEISADALSASRLQDAVSQHGYLLVRGLFEKSFAHSLCEDVDRSLQARMAVANPDSNDGSNGPWYYESPNFPGLHASNATRARDGQYGETGSIRVADSPRGAFRVLEQYRSMGLRQLLQEYFRDSAVIATKKWVFRLIAPRKNVRDGVGGGWHQDGQFMGEGVKALNMWVALSSCGDGTDAPGIALIPKRIEQVLEFGTGGAKKRWMVGPEVVEALAADAAIVRPRFEPGDALFFDQFSLHRSGHAPGQTRNRYALESWFYAASADAGNAVIPLY